MPLSIVFSRLLKVFLYIYFVISDKRLLHCPSWTLCEQAILSLLRAFVICLRRLERLFYGYSAAYDRCACLSANIDKTFKSFAVCEEVVYNKHSIGRGKKLFADYHVVGVAVSKRMYGRFVQIRGCNVGGNVFFANTRGTSNSRATGVARAMPLDSIVSILFTFSSQKAFSILLPSRTQT